MTIHQGLHRRERLLVEGRDPAREGGNKRVEIGVGYGAVDEAVPLRPRGTEIVAAEQNLERAGTAQKRGKPFDGAPAGNDADRDFGLAEKCALEARETQITCQHELVPPIGKAETRP
jgi:hypothetical protein